MLAKQSRLTDHTESSLAPICRLPPEILGYILLLNCVENNFNTTPQSPSSRLSSAFVYSQVCQVWRDTALNTPRMWTNITIGLNFDSGFYAEPGDDDCHTTIMPLGYVMRRMFSVRTALQYCLQRSSQSPLNLKLEFGSIDDLGDAGNVIMEDLFVHSYRWRSLSMSFADLPQSVKAQTCHRVDKQFSMGIRELPLLEHFGIMQDMFAELRRFTLIIQRASRLRSARLDFGSKATRINEESSQNVPWAQLSNLEVIAAPYDGMEKILSRCENLSTLSIENGAHFLPRPLETVSFKHLHTLSLGKFIECGTIGFAATLQGVFSFLVLPALTTLTISENDVPPVRTNLNSAGTSWPQEVFSEFMSRSQCSLTSLSLDRIPITDSEVLSVLRLVPTLINLEINEPAIPGINIITDRFFKNLYVSTLEFGFGNEKGDTLLPRLRDLKIRVTQTDLRFSMHQFVEMVMSRWLPNALDLEQVGVHCIRKVTLVVLNRRGDEGRFEKAAYHALMQLEDAGLQVEVSGLDLSTEVEGKGV